MGAILQSLGRTVAASVVLVILLALLAGNVPLGHAWGAFVMRWLHVVAGIMWIGLLWYFNFVQIPSMPKIPDEHKPAIGKVIAPEALFWFRWAALATVVTGILVAWMNGYIGTALALQRLSCRVILVAAEPGGTNEKTDHANPVGIPYRRLCGEEFW